MHWPLLVCTTVTTSAALEHAEAGTAQVNLVKRVRLHSQ